MAFLMFNQTLEIFTEENKGLWRVVSPATSKNDFNVLVHIPESISQWKKQREVNQPRLKWLWLSPHMCNELEQSEQMKLIELHPHPALRKPGSALADKLKVIREAREVVMRRLIDPMDLTSSLKNKGTVYLLVKEAMHRCHVSKKHVYELFTRLCWYGFENGSLNPHFYRCGAPGVARPWKELRPKVGARPANVRFKRVTHDLQAGMTAETTKMVVNYYKRHKTPSKSFENLYVDLIKDKYIKEYRMTDEGRQPIDPPDGSYPNRRQVRYAISRHLTAVQKLALSLHKKDFIRNNRGLKGHSWEGVAGPGHRYVIDATMADIYLRSQINPVWIIGRPIIYFIIDTWSTAIVAFHLCLNGPSWDTAKVALFNLLNPELSAELWGFKFRQCLFPLPQLPFELMSDRGEHLSFRAAESAKELGYNQLLNPAYEPDKKGLGEVFNRIAKDKQYGVVPGAIDSRRRAVEARTNPEDGVFTLNQYYKFIQGWVEDYNLNADKRYRLTDEMIGMGVKPNPASIWKFGFEEMMGYGKAVPFSKSIMNLLPSAKAAVNKKGVYLKQLEYRYPMENEWTAIARNFGSFNIQVYYFPGAVELIFYFSEDLAEVVTLTLSPHARAARDISHDDWLDSIAYANLVRSDSAYQIFVDKLRLSVRNDELIKEARDALKAAQLYELPKLSVTEARTLEKDMHGGVAPIPIVVEDVSLAVHEVDPWRDAYDGLMDEILKDDLILAGAEDEL